MDRAHRTIAGILVAGTAVILAVGTALAATWAPAVTPSTAKPGDEMTVTVDAIGGSASWGTDLYLIPSAAFLDGTDCAQMSGAIKVGSMTWTHDGINHSGVAHFTLPHVSDGSYSFGLEKPPCFLSGTLTVEAGVANTAVGGGPKPHTVWLMIVGLLILGGAVWGTRLELYAIRA